MGVPGKRWKTPRRAVQGLEAVQEGRGRLDVCWLATRPGPSERGEVSDRFRQVGIPQKTTNCQVRVTSVLKNDRFPIHTQAGRQAVQRRCPVQPPSWTEDTMKIAFPNLKSLLAHATVQEWPPPDAAMCVVPNGNPPHGNRCQRGIALPNSRPTCWRRRSRRFPERIPIAQGQPNG